MATNFLQAMGLPFNPDDPYGAAMQPPAPPVDPQALGNVMQGLDAPQASPAALAAPVAPIDAGGTRPARARSSLLDTIGRLSDVFATVGGAQALYQPTLDARQDRSIALGDHDRQVDLDKLKQNLTAQQIQIGNGTLTDAQSARVTQGMKYLDAIRTANPNADVSKIWPLIAQQTGIPAENAAAIGHAITENPDIIAGFADAGNKEKYSGSVVYGIGPDGKLVAYQPNLSDGKSRSILPEGVTATEPYQTVNTGGSTVVIGKNTGTTKRILPNTEKPGAAADRTQRGQIAADRNATAVKIAGMPARAQAPKAKAGGSGDPANVLTMLDNIQHGFDDLHGKGSLPGDNSGVVGNVLGALGRTHIGQAIAEQAGNPSAQKRLEIQKNVSQLQQEMLKSLPASATRTRFEQEMLARGLPDPSKMSYGTAQTVIRQLRESYVRAIKESQAGSSRPTLQAPVKPSPNGGKQPTVTNW